MSAWLRAFLFTQLVEVPVYAGALRGRSWPTRLAIAFGASALTHPVVWFLFPRWIPGRDAYVTMVCAAETFAVLVEAAWVWRAGLRRALAWSLLANGASLTLGLLLRHLGARI